MKNTVNNIRLAVLIVTSAAATIVLPYIDISEGECLLLCVTFVIILDRMLGIE